jgi:hypothetical protein
MAKFTLIVYVGVIRGQIIMSWRPRTPRALISLRVEVSLFVLSPEIEDRDEVEVATEQAQEDLLL